MPQDAHDHGPAAQGDVQIAGSDKKIGTPATLKVELCNGKEASIPVTIQDVETAPRTVISSSQMRDLLSKAYAVDPEGLKGLMFAAVKRLKPVLAQQRRERLQQSEGGMAADGKGSMGASTHV